MSSDSDDNPRHSPPPAPRSRDSKKRPRRSQRNLTMAPPPPTKRHRSMAPSPQPKPEPHLGTPRPQMKLDLDVRHIFIVTQAGITPTTEPTFTVIGVYSTLVDANNKVVELWEGEKQLWQGGAEESKEKEGTIWWKAEDKWGNKMEVRAEKRELVSGGIGKEKRWGKDRPFKDENFVASAF